VQTENNQPKERNNEKQNKTVHFYRNPGGCRVYDIKQPFYFLRKASSSAEKNGDEPALHFFQLEPENSGVSNKN